MKHLLYIYIIFCFISNTTVLKAQIAPGTPGAASNARDNVNVNRLEYNSDRANKRPWMWWLSPSRTTVNHKGVFHRSMASTGGGIIENPFNRDNNNNNNNNNGPVVENRDTTMSQDTEDRRVSTHGVIYSSGTRQGEVVENEDTYGRLRMTYDRITMQLALDYEKQQATNNRMDRLQELAENIVIISSLAEMSRDLSVNQYNALADGLDATNAAVGGSTTSTSEIPAFQVYNSPDVIDVDDFAASGYVIPRGSGNVEVIISDPVNLAHQQDMLEGANIASIGITHMHNQIEGMRNDLYEIMRFKYEPNQFDTENQFLTRNEVTSAMNLAEKILDDNEIKIGKEKGLNRSRIEYLENMIFDKYPMFSLQALDYQGIANGRRQQIYRLRQEAIKQYSLNDQAVLDMMGMKTMKDALVKNRKPQQTYHYAYLDSLDMTY